ncbi:MAG: hypothetical protein ABH884_02685 [Candidatus Komeilibacteria bacterium]
MVKDECRNLILCTFTEEFPGLALDLDVLHTHVCQVVEPLLGEDEPIDIEISYQGDENKIEYYLDIILTDYQRAELDIKFMIVLMSILNISKKTTISTVSNYENYYYVEVQLCFSISDEEFLMLKNNVRRLFKEVLKLDIDGELEVLEVEDEPYVEFDVDHGLSAEDREIIQSMLYIITDYVLGFCDPSDADNWDYADA